MTEAAPHVEFIIGEEKRLADIVCRAEIEPLLRSVLKLGITRAGLLDEDELPLVVLENGSVEVSQGNRLHQRLPILVEGEPKGTLVLEAIGPVPGFEALARLVHDTLQLTVTNNLKRMLTTEVHTSVVQESYEQLVSTNRRLMESERRYRNLAHDLEKKVEERTTALQQAYNRMLQQEKLAAVGQLAAGMAHEINTPLGFVRSNLHSFAKYQERLSLMLALYRGLLEQGAPAAAICQQTEQRWKELKLDFVLTDSVLLLEQSLEGADRIARIVSELKGFAHLDGMEEQPMDLRHELEQLLAGLAPHFPPNTRLMAELSPLPPLVCRVPLMVQAFANILDNALKSRSEGLELTVRAMADTERLAVEIGDNGCGIPPENLTRVFEPFFTTREVGQGSGMGLTVAREAIVSSGGTIEVRSKPTLGTSVTISFPLSAPVNE